MNVLGRIPVIVRPRQPFAEWINALPDAENPMTVGELDAESHVFLMYDYGEEENRDLYFLDIMEDIFEFELEEWTLDRTLWPKDRSEKVFREWFDMEMMGLAIDPYDEIVEDEDLDGEWPPDEEWEDKGDDAER